ncbi:isomerase [Purpureocillium lavendulum]|uniref:Isomerase n=1 Tax=Purpureocillium lavendulum TaxID=1247861 RepID=A0AB34FR88_9HYPO|nr:isomerase [Purpureocillium lavendulum]
MSPIASAASRLSSPAVAATARRAAANFSTSARSLKPADAASAASPSSSSSSWAWRNLSPKTRRYVVYGLGAGAAIDSYVIYNYFPGVLGLGEGKKNYIIDLVGYCTRHCIKLSLSTLEYESALDFSKPPTINGDDNIQADRCLDRVTGMPATPDE